LEGVTVRREDENWEDWKGKGGKEGRRNTGKKRTVRPKG